MTRLRLPLLLPAVLALVSPVRAGAPDWSEELHLVDGRYNNAARLAVDRFDGIVRIAWKAQLDTDSNTRQIVTGKRDAVPPSWSWQDLTTNVSSKEYPDICVTVDGVAHVVWREHLGGGAWQVMYANDRGGAWSGPRQLTFDATVKGSPVVAAIDSSGVVHIAYSTLETGTTNDEIWYLRYDSIGETADFLPLTSDAVTDDDASIAVSEDGSLVSIAWLTGPLVGSVRCFEGSIAGFTEIPTGVTAAAAQPDLAMAADGTQHIVYRHTVSSSVRTIRYIRRSGAGFTTPVEVSGADAFYTQPSIAVSFLDVPNIAFVSNTTGFRGFYLSRGEPDPGPPLALMDDPSVTYNETDLVTLTARVGLPLGTGAGFGWAVVSAGYVEGDSVKADLYVFAGSVYATAAPEPVRSAVGTGWALTARPNPFRTGTELTFTLPSPLDRVIVDVIDVGGRRVARLADGARRAGPQSVRWNPSGATPAGVYWLRVASPDGSRTVAVRRLR